MVWSGWNCGDRWTTNNKERAREEGPMKMKKGSAAAGTDLAINDSYCTYYLVQCRYLHRANHSRQIEVLDGDLSEVCLALGWLVAGDGGVINNVAFIFNHIDKLGAVECVFILQG